MSLIALAESIDRLVDTHHAFIAEAETTATISALSAHDATDLVTRCQTLGWAIGVSDSTNNPWPVGQPLDQDFAPFRLVIRKPAAPGDTLQLLSNHGFALWLKNGHHASHWQIARLVGTLVTGTRVLQPWGEARRPLMDVPRKSPQAFVREFGNERRVPEDIRTWLATSLDEERFASPAIQVWVQMATTALVYSLPDEIELQNGALKFRGPPRLTLPAPIVGDPALDLTAFNALLAASHWVFENERETEMRHILLSAELARSGAAATSTVQFLGKHLADAWESAQIAYQMAIADTSRDTLKALGDLRKTITDETAKLSDLGRQLATSIAGALATGIGLVAARVAANASSNLTAAIMAVVVVYVAMVIVSGSQFIGLQRRLRAEWQPKLYRFLPSDEYERLVAIPAAQAERSFIWTAALGGSAVFILAIACAWPLIRMASPAAHVPPQSSSPPRSTPAADPLRPPVPPHSVGAKVDPATTPKH